jgi:ribosomal protein S27AE
MLAQHSAHPLNGPITLRPACPNCGRSMHLKRTSKAADGLGELRTFACGECGVYVTEAAAD